VPCLYLSVMALVLFSSLGGVEAEITDLDDKIWEGFEKAIGKLIDFFTALIEYTVHVIVEAARRVLRFFATGPLGYVLPIGIALAAITILFLWKFLRVVIDLIPFW